MAILWKQKEMVETLQRLEDEEIARVPTYPGMTLEKAVHETYAHPKGWAMWEAILLKEMLAIQWKDDADLVAISNNQKILNACIKDGFIYEIENEEFTNTFPLPEGVNSNANVSQRRIQVSGDKGAEIMNGWYFWLKYIPGALRPAEQVAVQIFVALITTLITVYLIKK